MPAGDGGAEDGGVRPEGSAPQQRRARDPFLVAGWALMAFSVLYVAPLLLWTDPFAGVGMPLQQWWLETTLLFLALSLPAIGSAALAHHNRDVGPLIAVAVLYFFLSIPFGGFPVTGSAVLWLVAAGLFAARHHDSATRLVALGLAGSTTLAVSTATVYLGGLFTDPGRAPEVVPIEVVVGGARPCSLSLAEVGAGVHDVHLIAEVHPATVRIFAADGEVVLQATAVPQLPRGSRGTASTSQEPLEEVEAGAGEARPLELRPGTYTVECTTAAEPVRRTTLSVVAARDG